MNQHSRFNLPLCLIVEDDAFKRTDEILSSYMPDIKGQKTLILTDDFLYNAYSETLNELRTDFSDAEIMIVKDASFDEAVTIGKKLCVEDITVVVGFGGGRVLDTAKYAAHVSKSVYICLPTSLSNDSLASPFSVLGSVGVNRKTFSCKIPAAIVVDTDVIRNSPASQTLSGIGDTISKHTALYDWQLSAKSAGTHVEDFAYAISRMAFDSVYHCDNKDLKSPTFIRILSRALVMGGLAMEIAGSSRPCSGSEHLFVHALEEYYPQIKISHGMGVALGSIAACIFQGRDEQQLIKVLKEYGLDINPMSYGITEEIFVDAWEKAREIRKGRVTILNETEYDSQWMHEIYNKMCV